MTYWFRSAVACVCLFCWIAKLSAQPPILNSAMGDISPDVESRAEDVQADATVIVPTKREEIAGKLRVAQRTLDSAKETSEQSNAKPPERLQHEVELLKQLEVAAAQQESAVAIEKDQQTRLSDLQGQLESVRDVGPPEEKPYSFLLLDSLRDELASRRLRIETVEAAVASATEAVTLAKQTLEAKQQALRQAKAAEEANKSEDKNAEVAVAAKLAQLEANLAAELLAVKRQERANQELAIAIHEVQTELVAEKVKWIEKAVVFSAADLQDQLVQIDKQEMDLKSSQRTAETNLEYEERRWSALRQALDTVAERSVELVEQVEAKQITRQLYQSQVSLRNTRLQRLTTHREIWNRRFKVIRESAETDELITWGEEARTLLAQLEREKRLQQMRIDELRQDIGSREKELQATKEDAEPVRRHIEEQRDALSRLIQSYDANIVSIEATRVLAEKLLREIEGDVNSWTFGEWIETAKHHVGKVWNMELMQVDDHPLTVGKVVVGVLLIFLGFILSRMLSGWLGGRLQSTRIGMPESAAAALQSVSFYVLLVCFTLTSLRFVNVPLTMFTFLGGAIAIGVGFGSQNVLNNFISGLILLAERPIKVGDLIEVDDLYGNVEQIGARSTVIRTGDNLDIIVPNSTFLESNVVNLTRGDDKLRTKVCVGIAYGSPTREATRLMKNAAAEHGLVLARPEPFVWFTDFGDNSLNFEVHFWVKVRSLSDRLRTESDIRYRIDQLFREAGITIAFPQRDVHLDATQPVPVRVVSPSGEATFSQPDNSAAV